MKVLSQNGKWAKYTYNCTRDDYIRGSSYVLENKIFQQMVNPETLDEEYEIHYNGTDLALTFDLVEKTWRVQREYTSGDQWYPIMCCCTSSTGVALAISGIANEKDKYMLLRFDTTKKLWVPISEAPKREISSSFGWTYYQMQAIEDSIYIIEENYDVSSLFILHIFKMFDTEDGEFSGCWEASGLEIGERGSFSVKASCVVEL